MLLLCGCDFGIHRKRNTDPDHWILHNTNPKGEQLYLCYFAISLTLKNVFILDGVEDCLELWGQDFPGLLWNDKECTSRRHYICETNSKWEFFSLHIRSTKLTYILNLNIYGVTCFSYVKRQLHFSLQFAIMLSLTSNILAWLDPVFFYSFNIYNQFKSTTAIAFQGIFYINFCNKTSNMIQRKLA